MKTRTSLVTAAVGAALFLVLGAAPAAAAQLRTWVSHDGSNSNDCSVSAPCRTFQAAFDRVAAVGGEIGCLDSGSFGPLLINHSVTLDCRNVNATIDAIGVGILINAPVRADISLMGLKIQAPGPKEIGIAAVRLHNLTVRDTTILAGGAGIVTAPTGSAEELFVSDTTITGPAYGIEVGALAGNQNYRAVLDHVHIRDCAEAGIYLTSQSGTGLQLVSIVDSDIADGGAGLSINPAGATERILANVVRSEISYNMVGVSAVGPRGQVRMRDSTITGNGNGLETSGGGAILSYGNNALFGSITTDGTFTATLPRQ